MMTSTAFVLSSVQRLALQAIRAGWIPSVSSEFVLVEWQIFQSLSALVLALVGVRMLSTTWSSLKSTERMVETLVDRLPGRSSMEGFGLTPREAEVLQEIGKGNLSDQQIGDVLYISPATAQTHVKRILRKTGLNNRRELMLLQSDRERRSEEGVLRFPVFRYRDTREQVQT